MSRPDGSDRPPLKDIFDELPPEELRRQRRGEDDTGDDVAGDDAPTDVDTQTQAQQGGPGTFERAGALLDNIVEVGGEQFEKAGDLAEAVADAATGLASKAAQAVGSAANSAWEGATGGGDDDDGDDDDGGDSSGGDTISGGDLTELQSSPSDGLDPGVYVEEISLHPASDDSVAPPVETDVDSLADDGDLLT